MIPVLLIRKELAYRGRSLVDIVRDGNVYRTRFPETLMPWHLTHSLANNTANLAFIHPMKYITPRNGKKLLSPSDLNVLRVTELEKELPCEICVRLSLFDCTLNNTNFHLNT